MDALQQLHDAAWLEDAVGVAAALAAGAAVDGELRGTTALHRACLHGSVRCVRLLLAAGADPALRDEDGWCAIHVAAFNGHADCIATLLEAGADPLATTPNGSTALHFVAQARWVRHRYLPAARLLLQAAPQAALMLTQPSRGSCGKTPLMEALTDLQRDADRLAVARYLLKAAPIAARDTGSLLAILRQGGERALPLYPLLVARLPLTAAQWAGVPSPCPILGVVLPAVLQRSEAEAAQLVRCLPPADQQRLRTLTLCLAAAARRGLLPPLPADVVRLSLVTVVQQGSQDHLRQHERLLAAATVEKAQQQAGQRPEMPAPWWHNVLSAAHNPYVFIATLSLA